MSGQVGIDSLTVKLKYSRWHWAVFHSRHASHPSNTG